MHFQKADKEEIKEVKEVKVKVESNPEESTKKNINRFVDVRVNEVNKKKVVYEGARNGLSFPNGKNGEVDYGMSKKELQKKWAFATDEYLKGYVVIMGHKDARLNINDPHQSLKLQLLKVHPWVANSSVEINQHTLYIIFDEEHEATEANKKFDYKLNAYKHISNMSSEERGEFLRLFGKSTYRVSHEIIMNKLEEEATKNPRGFCEKYEDKNKRVKMLVKELVEHRIFRTEKTTLYYNDVVIGINEARVLDFMNDPKNGEFILQLKTELSDRKK